MINKYKHNGETWIDIHQGSSEEVKRIMDEYEIHPFVAKEIKNKTPKPRIEFHENYLYCILHFPTWKINKSDERKQEIDFIIGKDFLITTRYDHINSLHNFSKNMEVSEILSREKNGDSEHGQVIFLSLLKELYSGLFEELDHIEDLTENITSKIFHGKEKEMVVSISEVTRTLINFEKVTNLHHEILDALKKKGGELFGDDFTKEMELIIINFQKINTNIKFSLEMLRELRNTNNSLLTSKQNEIVKELTVMGFVILPLNLIAWIFAMRVEGLPFLDNPNGFLIVAGLMITSASIALVYAKHKRWM
jgi:magnesium transporter